MSNYPVNTSEFDELVSYLEDNNYPYEVTLYGERGLQVVVYDDDGDEDWDAVCNPISYGHQEGLLEIMGSLVKDTVGVEGWLTANDIIERLEGLNASN